MTLEQVKELEGQIITVEQSEVLEESDHIESWENCGMSGVYPSCLWYVYNLTDGEELNVYIK